ncbi:MAG: hypothetical protein K9H84_08095, partial [Bacteroidales bacterium]|nr:hypothetical protein [Bacteroidales bacterium]
MVKKEKQEQMHHHAGRFSRLRRTQFTTQTFAVARFCSVTNDNGYVKREKNGKTATPLKNETRCG